MDFATLETLRLKHPAWRLLVADHASLIVSFLHRVFVESNARATPQRELVLRLDDHLHALRERRGEAAFPRSAGAYLDEWAADSAGWLRKFYPPDTDEPHFDLTPAAERAIRWLSQLTEQPFVGTESRLLTVFHLLQEMTEGTEPDPEARLVELERRKAEVEAEIARVRAGHLDLMDESALKDRFQQMSDTARGLLSDFRALEDGFHALDRRVRERIATWEGTRGELLETVLGERDAINGSDQGRSFRAFWDFLMSPERKESLTRNLERVLAHPAIQSLQPDSRLPRIHFDWLEAGEHTQRTVARLSGQLRRFLDDRVWLENRRILQVLRGIEKHALAVRTRPPTVPLMSLDELAPTLELPLERPMYSPPARTRMADEEVLEATEDVPSEALFNLAFIDKARLKTHVREALQSREQISLAELVREHPLQHGLAELVVYLSLASEDRRSSVDEARTQELFWTDASGHPRRATLPLVLFLR
ncbi:DUF3375 domain-containing protein [Myxococcus sp. CA051A]|uniref:DUF3375 domain-containing protein n=1 Tax=unclassified Myxococcus TaxID=2648731 RepID=UPI00157A946D|nr:MULTISPECIES: DUF3375 domain-containing protein [unclassified Myxococcus]NTX16463.1 DUF3375 domain-containing protein [Myxococcus sp. CA056]NTX62791.1 DUF3375 domain-containing protein [Myxococcus sp. CA051A]